MLCPLCGLSLPIAVTGEAAGADAPTLWGAQTCKTPSPHEGHPLLAHQSWQDHPRAGKLLLLCSCFSGQREDGEPRQWVKGSC